MDNPAHPPIRVALVGIGRAGWGMHLPELAARAGRFAVVGAHDLDLSRAEAVRARLGCTAHATYAEVLADPTVEVVDIATRSPDHVPQALQAMAAGKTVFLEKPIALTHADAVRLQHADAAGPGRLYCRHNRRFETGFIRIRQLIAEGVLGEVHTVKLRRHNFSRRDDWQTSIACGGGQLNNWGPHLVDHALRFLEAPVASMWSDLKRIAAVGDAEDHLKIVLRGTNGRVVDLEVSGGTALSEPEFSVLGSRGGLTCSGDTIRLRHLDPAVQLPPRRLALETPPNEGAFGTPDPLPWIERELKASETVKQDPASIWDALYDTIRLGRPFPVTLDEAVEVVRIIDGARQASAFTAG